MENITLLILVKMEFFFHPDDNGWQSAFPISVAILAPVFPLKHSSLWTFFVFKMDAYFSLNIFVCTEIVLTNIN
jgi:hypothetical protein